MYNYTMKFYRNSFINIIAARRRAIPEYYGTLSVNMILYNAGAKCLSEGKDINYANMLDNLLGK